MRVADIFKRLLGIDAVRVRDVEVGDVSGEELVTITLERRRNRKMHCGRCGQRARSVYDRQVRSWRHLDAFRVRCILRAEVRRVICSECGICAEAVPWARPGSRVTRAFEDTCVWLVRRAPKSVVAELMRIDWATVRRMIERVVAEHSAQRIGDGLDGLARIGIDEVAYRKGHRYLLCVTDHSSGRLVWAAPGRSRTTLTEFFTALGPERCRAIEAISVDLHDGWMAAIRAHCPHAAICADPFHVIRLAGAALDEVRRGMWQDLRRTDPERASWIKGTWFAIRRRAARLRRSDQTILQELAARNHELYAGWLLVEQLRGVYLAHDHPEAIELLDDWVLAALASGMEPFQRTALTLDRYRTEIANSITLGLTNARLEGMNSTVRLISHRARGLPTSRVAAVDADARMRTNSRPVTHVNARRIHFRAIAREIGGVNRTGSIRVSPWLLGFQVVDGLGQGWLSSGRLENRGHAEDTRID